MKELLVSIIVPVYNCEKFISRCVKSIEEQSYPNIELILINDGSTDNSYDLCCDLSNKYKNINLITQENRGVSTARNRGIEETSGDYLLFIDADDYIEKNTVKTYVDTIAQYNCDCVFSNLYSEFDNGDKARQLHSTENIRIFDIDDFDFYQRGVLNKCFRTSIIKNNNVLFHEDIHYAEDTLFLVESYLCCNKIIHLPQAFYHYVLHNSSATHHFSERLFSEMDAWERIINILGDHKKTQERAKVWLSLNAKNIYILAKRNNYGDIRKIKRAKYLSKKYTLCVLSNSDISFTLKLSHFIYALSPGLYLKLLESKGLFKK